jgi:predicted HTH domain antitoxin
MGTISVEYPESLTATLNQSREAFEREARMAMAAKLFELGRLTSGQAAKLAGISRVSFLLECSRFGVPSVYWEHDEIEAEFEDFL